MRETKTYSVRRREKGFTAIEIIVVLVVLSVLTASIIIKNPFSISDYSAIAADQLIADIQYVQMRAMGIGTRQSIIFQSSSGIYCVCHVPVPSCTYAACSSTGERKTLPGGVVVSSLPSFGDTITFNTLGEPIYGSGTIRLSNTKDVTIYAVTGKVE